MKLIEAHMILNTCEFTRMNFLTRSITGTIIFGCMGSDGKIEIIKDDLESIIQ